MNKGFTLVELITSISVFTVIMVISMGSILGVFDFNRKARSLKTVITNLNFATESMSREIRFGENYHCGSSGTLTEPQNCAGGNTLLSFLSSDGVQTIYRFNNQRIERSINGEDYVPVTGRDIVIDNMTFYVLGAGTGDDLQPKVIIKIQSHADVKSGQTNFTLQTMASQRALDIDI